MRHMQRPIQFRLPTPILQISIGGHLGRLHQSRPRFVVHNLLLCGVPAPRGSPDLPRRLTQDASPHDFRQITAQLIPSCAAVDQSFVALARPIFRSLYGLRQIGLGAHVGERIAHLRHGFYIRFGRCLCRLRELRRRPRVDGVLDDLEGHRHLRLHTALAHGRVIQRRPDIVLGDVELDFRVVHQRHVVGVHRPLRVVLAGATDLFAHIDVLAPVFTCASSVLGRWRAGRLGGHHRLARQRRLCRHHPLPQLHRALNHGPCVGMVPLGETIHDQGQRFPPCLTERVEAIQAPTARFRLATHNGEEAITIAIQVRVALDQFQTESNLR